MHTPGGLDASWRRHHVYEKNGNEVVLKEIGPRFELKLYHIKLGNFNQKTAETEVRNAQHQMQCERFKTSH